MKGNQSFDSSTFNSTFIMSNTSMFKKETGFYREEATVEGT